MSLAFSAEDNSLIILAVALPCCLKFDIVRFAVAGTGSLGHASCKMTVNENQGFGVLATFWLKNLCSQKSIYFNLNDLVLNK